MSWNPSDSEFSSDGEAVQFLEKAGYLCEHGAIIPPGLEHQETQEENRAITFLCEQWDWEYLKGR